ncbi:hypothetical protein [Shewanella sp. NKUCC06_TVS]|jgi:hypothetical protein|uniref:hypothetical protein n=1 Tax=Shewanella sp. NKUCC06_TVS TaxID=2842128 RepID=UPI001C5B146F|nr:hypothetical protein [Shewanella sp. NKUCC06_TVS]MBW3532296.1 hypothetical protein [Shewanella sp. NKUCC06_TVS]
MCQGEVQVLRNYHIVLFFIVSLFGCEQKAESTSKQVEANIVQALKVGDDAKAIENYLNSQKIQFSYDKYTNRFQGIIRDQNSNLHAITISIVLDNQQRYVNVEVNDSYISL